MLLFFLFLFLFFFVFLFFLFFLFLFLFFLFLFLLLLMLLFFFFVFLLFLLLLLLLFFFFMIITLVPFLLLVVSIIQQFRPINSASISLLSLNFFHSRGFIKNCVDFFGLRCLGLCRPVKVNWAAQYTTDVTLSSSTTYISVSSHENYQFV